MCIIAIPNLPITDFDVWGGLLKNMVKNNPDGNGVIYELKNGELWWNKNMSINDIKDVMVMRNLSRLYIHCRAASHGVINRKMMHPFLISHDRDISTQSGQLQKGEALLMQNGIFSTLPTHKIKSDTAVMCESIKAYTPYIKSAEKLVTFLMNISPASKFVAASPIDGIWRTTNFIKSEHGIFSNNTHIKPKERYVGRVLNDIGFNYS